MYIYTVYKYMCMCVYVYIQMYIYQLFTQESEKYNIF
jgi:hypothetical protein